MNENEFLKSLENVYCRLRPSKDGVGVFAVKQIPKGTNPFIGCFEGEFIPIAEEKIRALSPEIQELIIDFCPFQDGLYDVPECGLNAVDISFFINHSDTPNMEENGDDYLFYALRDIEAGEELSVDYTTYCDYHELDPIYKEKDGNLRT